MTIKKSIKDTETGGARSRMTDEKARLREKYLSDPDRYQETRNGSIQDRQTGKIVFMDPSRNPHAITQANAVAYQKRSAERRRADYLRGIIIGRGEEPPPDATLEELEELATVSRVHMWAHWYKTFMKSSNLRGMSESGNRLIEGPGEKPDQDPDERQSPISPRVIMLLAEYSKRKARGEVIDAEESDG